MRQLPCLSSSSGLCIPGGFSLMLKTINKGTIQLFFSLKLLVDLESKMDFNLQLIEHISIVISTLTSHSVKYLRDGSCSPHVREIKSEVQEQEINCPSFTTGVWPNSDSNPSQNLAPKSLYTIFPPLEMKANLFNILYPL